MAKPVVLAGGSELRTIADIGKERIRRVIQKITTENTEHTEKEKTDNPLFHQGNTSVSSVVQPPGFKVFKLDRSNFKAWQAEAADVRVAVSAGEKRLRNIYRALLNVAGVYYYLSLPVVILPSLTVQVFTTTPLSI